MRLKENPLLPRNFAEAERLARLIAESDLVPKEYRGKPGNVLIALQWGWEVGLHPMQALQSVAVINGRPSIWGDAAIALVRSHPACEYIREWLEGTGDARVATCEIKRRGELPQRRTFSVADAKRAGLWGKPGPWQQYPERMLQMRARGFALRDVFPDALRGIITAEEAMDYPNREERQVINIGPQQAPAVPSISTSIMLDDLERKLEEVEQLDLLENKQENK